MRGVIKMEKIYVTQIKLGNITLDRVPPLWRGQVEKLLAEQIDNGETAAE